MVDFQQALLSEDGHNHYLRDEKGQLLFTVQPREGLLPLVLDYRTQPPFQEVIPCPWCGTDKVGKHDTSKHVDTHKRTTIVAIEHKEEIKEVKKDKAPHWAVQLFDQRGYITSIFGISLEEVKNNVSKEKHPNIVACSIPFLAAWYQCGEFQVQDVRGAPKVAITSKESRS